MTSFACEMAVVISVTKEGVKFSTRGDIGNANIVCRQNTTVDKVFILSTLYTHTHTLSLSVCVIWNNTLLTCAKCCCLMMRTARGSHHHRDARASVINLCSEIHELFHQSHSAVKHCDHQPFFWATSGCRVQGGRHGLYQVLLGTQDWRWWGHEAWSLD